MLGTIVIQCLDNYIFKPVTDIVDQVENIENDGFYSLNLWLWVNKFELPGKRFPIFIEHQTFGNDFEHDKDPLGFVNQISETETMDVVVLVEDFVDEYEDRSDVMDLEESGAANVLEN